MTRMQPETSAAGLWVGVDVSKNFLDVSIGGSSLPLRLANAPEGFAALCERLARYPVRGVAIEATGGYERALFTALHASAVPAAIINPARVREFAKATGRLAKTDRIDAAVIADYAALTRPAASPLPSTARAKLTELLAFRRQIVDELTARKCQIKHYSGEIRARAEAAKPRRARAAE